VHTVEHHAATKKECIGKCAEMQCPLNAVEKGEGSETFLKGKDRKKRTDTWCPHSYKVSLEAEAAPSLDSREPGSGGETRGRIH
jgi:predicted lipoprotein with Yx(FWY)xxD motif